MRPRIIGLMGDKRSGKDTVGDYLRDYYPFTKASFGGALKQAASILLDVHPDLVNGHNNYDREQVMDDWGFSIRAFLQTLGTDCIRDKIHPDFWVIRLDKEIKRLNSGCVVITDLRFRNEFKYVKDNNGIVIKIIRDFADATDPHVSEREKDLLTPDYVINNGFTYDELYHNVDLIMEGIGYGNTIFR